MGKMGLEGPLKVTQRRRKHQALSELTVSFVFMFIFCLPLQNVSSLSAALSNFLFHCSIPMAYNIAQNILAGQLFELIKVTKEMHAKRMVIILFCVAILSYTVLRSYGVIFKYMPLLFLIVGRFYHLPYLRVTVKLRDLVTEPVNGRAGILNLILLL